MKKTMIYIGFITTLCLGGCSSLTQRTTDVVYLIPDGYEGDLIVLYNVPGAKPLQTEDGFRVVSFSPDGTAITSTKDMKYGIVNDKYYIIDKEGKRTKLDSSCIRPKSTGSSTDHVGEGNEHTFRFGQLEVTRTACGPQFESAGRKVPESQPHPSEKKLEDLIQSVYDQNLLKQK
ncbi:DUF6843 domain-containing protein [Bacillus sp. JJ1127]|uniref:DUF6843 domain-containing protein n=1 Tax=Bacillus sp. JJ1127 TaxID=3122952 RepID=UPI003F689EC1